MSIFSLAERVALVTGASRGLGWAIAEALAGAGARLVLCGREEATLAPRVEALRARGHAAMAIAFDVTDRGAVERAVDTAVEKHGRLDILVNNAGIQHRESVLDMNPADWDRVIETNLNSYFVLTRTAAAHMTSAGHGRIINTASVMGPMARPTVAAYVAAKGGVAALTRAIAVELGPLGITCNAIAPGFITTDMTRALEENAEFDAYMRARVPLGRWGRPEDIGGAAVYLASDAASYVNGHVLFVDGGLTVAI